MPFKKRKEAKAARTKQATDAHASEERQFDAAIEAAGQMTDPAEKALALKSIETQISRRLMIENSAIAAEAANKQGTVVVATIASVPVVLGGMAALILLAGPIGLVGIPVGLSSVFGGSYLAYRRGNTVRKQLEKAAGSHMECLKNQAARASAMADATVEENVEAITNSPLHKKILATPGLAEKFIKAAAKAKDMDASQTPDTDAAPPADAAPKKPGIIKDAKHL